MRYTHNRHRGDVGMGFNATAMVDVIFMLTIFFMLVTRFSEAELIPMKLPAPEQSQAKSESIPERVVINCRLDQRADGSEQNALFSIGPNQPESIGVLSDRLAGMKRASPGLKVVIRADRRLPYDAVRRAMRMVSAQGIEMLNVSAHIDDGS